LGKIHYGATAAEAASVKDRRSVYICQDLKAGETLTEANLKLIRPGSGLAPKYYDLVLGKRINADVKRGTPLSWDLIG
jgi:sialic acid synthase SpsE